MQSTPSSTATTLKIVPWIDPIVDEKGFPVHDPYIEMFCNDHSPKRWSAMCCWQLVQHWVFIPAAYVVDRARDAGKKVVIVNGGPTERDHFANLILQGDITRILTDLVARAGFPT